MLKAFGPCLIAIIYLAITQVYQYIIAVNNIPNHKIFLGYVLESFLMQPFMHHCYCAINVIIYKTYFDVSIT